MSKRPIQCYHIQVNVAEIGVEGQTSTVVGSFNSSALKIVVNEQNLYMIEGEKLLVKTLQVPAVSLQYNVY